MDEYARLIDKLLRIEALHAGATTAGERTAAAEARHRVADRLAGLKPTAPPEAEEVPAQITGPTVHD